MNAIVVADTSPLNYLVLCGAIEVLPRLFDRVFIPAAVAAELQHPSTPAVVRDWIAALPAWTELRMPAPVNLGLKLGRGEVEAIALGLQLKAAAVLMDDHKARLAAERNGLVVVGTLTLLEKAAERGLLDLSSALAALRRTTFHIKPHLLDEALARHQQRRQVERGHNAPSSP